LGPEFTDDSFEATIHIRAQFLEAAVHIRAQFLEAAVYSFEAMDCLLNEAVEVFAQRAQLGHFGPGREDILQGLLQFPTQGWVLLQQARQLGPQLTAEVRTGAS